MPLYGTNQKSTLPFSLDDPKSVEEIEELLIQLCNGQLSGNLRVGLHRPRSIPLLCCNFTVSNVQRLENSSTVQPKGSVALARIVFSSKRIDSVELCDTIDTTRYHDTKWYRSTPSFGIIRIDYAI